MIPISGLRWRIVGCKGAQSGCPSRLRSDHLGWNLLLGRNNLRYIAKQPILDLEGQIRQSVTTLICLLPLLLTLNVMNVDEGTRVDDFPVTEFWTRGKMFGVFSQRVVALLPPLKLTVTPRALDHVVRA